jgi:hypothetical protein
VAIPPGFGGSVERDALRNVAKGAGHRPPEGSAA